VSHRVVLVQAVELHELDAGRLEDFVARHFREDLLHDAVGAGVAVHVRLAEEFAVAADEAEVNAPRVDADAVQPHFAPRRRLA
jgi:hypothetical protein